MTPSSEAVIWKICTANEHEEELENQTEFQRTSNSHFGIAITILSVLVVEIKKGHISTSFNIIS